ncbi:Uncharacterised protein [Segatella copri]|nr:Uncharacterised protein [Segatella copri]
MAAKVLIGAICVMPTDLHMQVRHTHRYRTQTVIVIHGRIFFHTTSALLMTITLVLQALLLGRRILMNIPMQMVVARIWTYGSIGVCWQLIANV